MEYIWLSLHATPVLLRGADNKCFDMMPLKMKNETNFKTGDIDNSHSLKFIFFHVFSGNLTRNLCGTRQNVPSPDILHKTENYIRIKQ
jgi:hypothetical protein